MNEHESKNEKKIIIIGGGLAGVEAAYQVSRRGIAVELYEMRPGTTTGAHTTGFLGELVCSNSLGSTQVTSASGLLKEELKMLDSFFLRMAEKYRVPAGNSFSVDRIKLAECLTHEVETMPGVTLIRQELKEIPKTELPVIIA
ncbi:MAG TPA: FAD-dependent oxidoreductase, partial [Candidatus Deferrimicrobium sp.]|nr:FAD-dependent oxidoreductase [Candidatus Deferrimicrobium sp.]